MDRETFDRMIEEREEQMSLAFPALMRKVYVWMTLALVITGVTAYGVAASPSLIYTLMSSEYLFWGCLLGELGLVYFISSRIMNLSRTTATLLFIVYSILNGVTMSFIFLVYTTSSIANVFFITAGTFGAMSLIGYTTKRDLSKMGQLLMMALVGLIIASFANILMKSDTLSLIISYVGVVVFVGLTAWDTQKIKRMLAQADDISEDAQKVALLGALTLYLDFVNLFLYLLRLLGKRN